MEQRTPSGAADPMLDRGDSSAVNAPVRCSICQKRLGREIHFLDETGEAPEPRMSWALCDECSAAVRDQMVRGPVRGALRLRVAVGIVSTERTPHARRARIGEMTDRRWEALLFWSFLLFMLGHLVLVIIVASMQH